MAGIKLYGVGVTLLIPVLTSNISTTVQFPRSTCTKRVASILKEKNLSYEIIPIILAEKANTTPEYLERQPFGQVPVLDDNGYLIYGEGFLKFDLTPYIIIFLESRAIGRYIALKYASQGTQGLIPDGSDLEATGRFEEACSVEYAQFNPSAEGLGQELIFKKYTIVLKISLASKNSLSTTRFRGEETDPAAVAKHTATLQKKLDAYEKILSKRKYLAGDVIVFNFVYIVNYFC